MGTRPLDPEHISWLPHDAATSQIGWELFRQEKQLHWPLMYTYRIGYPPGESAALMDVNTLYAFLLKPFSHFLPEPFQYMGLQCFLAFALQYFFAVQVFRLLLKRGGGEAYIASTFYLLSPPLTVRAAGHFALTNHWLLLAALLLFFRVQHDVQSAKRTFVYPAIILSVVSVLINPYLALQVNCLLAASAASLACRRRLRVTEAGSIVFLLVSMCLFTAYGFGIIIPGPGNASNGYRHFSMNLLAPFNPQRAHSLLPQVHLAVAGQYEGYNYLGAGVILLGAIALAILFFHFDKLPRVRASMLVPLLLCCGLLMVLATSTLVTFGKTILVDCDPHQLLTPYLAIFRASGRFFWLPYYAVLTSTLVIPIMVCRKAWTICLLLLGFGIQVVDTANLRRDVHAAVSREHPSPLKSQVWSQLARFHQNLVVLPPWQCGSPTPGGGEGFRTFGFLAVSQEMRINSYYSARHSQLSSDVHCSESLIAVMDTGLSSTSAYVVAPEVAALISEGPTGEGRCHDVDDFILCSSVTDFGLSPHLLHPAIRLRDAVINPSVDHPSVLPWRTFGDTQAIVSENSLHRAFYSIAQTRGHGSVSQDVTGLKADHLYAVCAWVSASPGTTAEAQIAISTNAGTSFSRSMVPNSHWQLLIHFTSENHPSTMRIHLFRGVGSGTVYWTEVAVFERQ